MMSCYGSVPAACHWCTDVLHSLSIRASSASPSVCTSPRGVEQLVLVPPGYRSHHVMRRRTDRERRLCVLLLVVWICSHAAAKNLKIYVYDLPEWKNMTEHGDIRHSDYGLDQVFPELLKASKYVTSDPEEADYFFADAWIFWPHALTPLASIVQRLRAMGPWFDRKNATDHIFVISADQGRCNGYHLEDVRHAIFLQHYGGSLHGTDFFTWEKVLLEKWGGLFDRELLLSEAVLAENHCAVQQPHHPQLECTADRHGQKVPFFCHVPYQDIVVPPTVFEMRPPRDCHHCHYATKNAELSVALPYLDAAAKELSENRIHLLFHAGSTHFHPAEFYSLGARQSMIQMFGHGKRPGFMLTPGEMSGDYWSSILTSVFCLATTGTGWGSRFKVAAVRGCIPVIMMDGVRNEFEEQLPLKEYAIRIPSFMWFRTPEILQLFIDSGRVKEMQENLKCAWRLHWWQPPHGRAFEVVMCELKRRMLGLRGQIKIDFKACTMTCIDETINLLS